MSDLRRRLYEQSVAAVEEWLKSPSPAVTADVLEHLGLLRWLLEKDLADHPRRLCAAVRAIVALDQ